ncbi:hypothetical protein G4B88_027392 [Cannabis sativa]|uniref:Uncharacterized protein n=1 Tax=Cannabis sativa TaxID=3483 RepID=A0A7J6HQU0_CANSA|nr:hypothetical protein G4B88_027392 [Cannabis sativa]
MDPISWRSNSAPFSATIFSQTPCRNILLPFSVAHNSRRQTTIPLLFAPLRVMPKIKFPMTTIWTTRSLKVLDNKKDSLIGATKVSASILLRKRRWWFDKSQLGSNVGYSERAVLLHMDCCVKRYEEFNMSDGGGEEVRWCR